MCVFMVRICGEFRGKLVKASLPCKLCRIFHLMVYLNVIICICTSRILWILFDFQHFTLRSITYLQSANSYVYFAYSSG